MRYTQYLLGSGGDMFAEVNFTSDSKGERWRIASAGHLVNRLPAAGHAHLSKNGQTLVDLTNVFLQVAQCHRCYKELTALMQNLETHATLFEPAARGYLIDIDGL